MSADVEAVVSKNFTILENLGEQRFEEGLEVYSYRVAPSDPSRFEEGFKELYGQLIRRGLYPQLAPSERSYLLRIVKASGKGYRRSTVLALLLISIFTVGFTAFTWYQGDLEIHSHTGVPTGSSSLGLLYVIMITASILAPLGVHELGHFVASKILRVPVTPPYFIPGLPGIGLGTFGAVILMRFPPAVADDLAAVAIAGPLAGFLAILPVTLYGLATSYIVPETAAPQGVQGIPYAPLLFYLAAGFVIKPGEGNIVLLNPVALAGYYLLLIHFLNLLPVAQLDGGQVLRSFVGPRAHAAVGILATAFTGILALITRSEIMITIASFLLIVSLLTGLRPHPGPAYRESRPSPRSLAALTLWILMILLTIPIPA